MAGLEASNEQVLREMGEAGTWQALHDSMDGALARIEAPCLLFWARDDSVKSVSHAELYTSVLSPSQLAYVEVDRGGHRVLPEYVPRMAAWLVASLCWPSPACGGRESPPPQLGRGAGDSSGAPHLLKHVQQDICNSWVPTICIRPL